jgi:hypothetical protein
MPIHSWKSLSRTSVRYCIFGLGLVLLAFEHAILFLGIPFWKDRAKGRQRRRQPQRRFTSLFTRHPLAQNDAQP